MHVSYTGYGFYPVINGLLGRVGYWGELTVNPWLPCYHLRIL